jgi:hypothetical protein
VFGWVADLFSTRIPTIIRDGIIPIAVDFRSSTGTTTSGNTNPATITQIVDDWINGVKGVGGAAAWKPFEKYMIINIANEWGPQNSTWQSTYITAVQSLRSAGFNNLLLIDAPGSGRDEGFNVAPFATTVIPYGPGIIEADPQHNIAFGCHVYGNIRAGQALSSLAPLAQSGLPAIIGEFGPGRNIGPSPTNLTPGELISACEQLGLGWLAWAFDDNNKASATSDDNWFALSWADNPGTPTQTWWPAGATGGAYAQSMATDLTTYGSNIILGTSPWGASPAGNVAGMCLSTLAKKCSVFPGGSPS